MPENPATGGLGRDDVAEPRPEVSGVGEQKIDLPSAYVTLYKKGTDEKIGTYLVSLWFTLQPVHRESQPKQTVTVDGKTYELALRFTRYYKPSASSCASSSSTATPARSRPRTTPAT